MQLNGDAATAETISSTTAHQLAAGANDEVWSCASRVGQLQVWRVSPATVLRTLHVDCEGFTALLSDRGVLWAGAQNGALYAVPLARQAVAAELRGHTDSVRSLCGLGPDHIASGASSGDGTVVVWRRPVSTAMPSPPPSARGTAAKPAAKAL